MGNDRSTPTMSETIQAMIENRLADVHTSIPGEIVSYDFDKNLAVVRPLIKRKYKNETEAIELPTISNVTVCFQRMNDAHLRLPIKPKDSGMIMFSERSIDKWSIQGGSVDPEDNRKHHISDATFWPGLSPNNMAMKSLAPSTSLELKYKTAYLEITQDGKFKMKGTSNEELYDLLSQTLAKMISLTNELGFIDTTNTIFGPLQPNNFSAYQTLKQDFFNIKSKLDTLKG